MGKHTIYFYKDKNGREPVLEYLKELLSQNSGLHQYFERTRHQNRRTVHKAH